MIGTGLDLYNTVLVILITFFLIQVKHFVCDFMLQTSYMYLNKGTFGHPGGLVHAFIHMIGSALVLSLIFPLNAVLWAVVLAESIAHYFIDWAKMNLNSYYKLAPNTSEKFWWLLGLDQLLHQGCYVIMLYLLLVNSRIYI